jgi:hypothetical protein
MMRVTVEIQSSGPTRRVAEIVIASTGSGDRERGDYVWSILETGSPTGSVGLGAAGMLRSHNRRLPASALVDAVLDAAMRGGAELPSDAMMAFLGKHHHRLDAPPPPEGSPASLVLSMIAATEQARLEEEARRPVSSGAERAKRSLTSLVLEAESLQDDTAMALADLIESALDRVADVDAPGRAPAPAAVLRAATNILNGLHDPDTVGPSAASGHRCPE